MIGAENVLITNNSLLRAKDYSAIRFEYHQVALSDLLPIIRDYLHQGYALCSEIQLGNIQAKDMLCRSVMLQKQEGQEICLDSLKKFEYFQEKFAPCQILEFKQDQEVLDQYLTEALIDSVKIG